MLWGGMEDGDKNSEDMRPVSEEEAENISVFASNFTDLLENSK